VSFEKGDLVRCKDRWVDPRVISPPLKPKWGIILEKELMYRSTNKVFKIWWFDGTIGNNVWDYDLLSNDGIES
jgi:hypothetical protein